MITEEIQRYVPIKATRVYVGMLKICLFICSLLFVPSSSIAQWRELGPHVLCGGVAGGAIVYAKGSIWAGEFSLVTSDDTGKTWRDLVRPFHAPEFYIQWMSALDSKHAILNANLIQITSDGGDTWTSPAAPGYTIYDGSPALMHSVYNEWIRTSFDSGATWWQSTPTKDHHPFYHLLLAPNHTMYASILDANGLHFAHSTDDGSSWTESTTTIPLDSYCAAVDSNDSKVLYVTSTNKSGPGNHDHSYFCCSTDGGDTWTQTPQSFGYFTGGLATTKHFVYASVGADGVVRSSDRGQTWTRISGVIPSGDFTTAFYTNDIAAASDSMIFVLTQDGSILETTNAGGPSSNSVVPSSTITEEHVVPNPITTQTIFDFSLSTPERVKLQIFDITGQTLREIERECTIGTNEITLDTHDLPPGCYWYVLHGGEYERSGKVVKF